jgi:hypothetical protein
VGHHGPDGEARVKAGGGSGESRTAMIRWTETQ